MRRAALQTLVALAVVATVLAAMTWPVGARPGAQPANRDVIVVLKVQHHAVATSGHRLEAQRSAYAANRRAESPVIARARQDGALNVHTYGLIGAFSATVSASQDRALASDPAVAHVFPDLKISMGPSLQRQIAGAGGDGKAASAASRASTAALAPICPSDPSHPLLEPEALGVTNTAFDNPATPQAQNIVDGTGVKVAYIADGIDINNPDFIRASGQHVFVDYQDFSGDGPNAITGAAEAFGDASAIAAQGRQVYDLSNFVNPAHPLPPGCNITVRGMAPGASLVGLKVFGNSNSAPTSHFIDAIDYAVTDGVDVLNESFGANPFPDSSDDPISLADNAAIAAGVTVVASTGDAGTTGTVGSPSSDPGVIGVGASTTFQSYLQTTNAGAQFSNGQWVSNQISGLSSGGTTQAARTPDLIAPGDLGWALCTPNPSVYEECTDNKGSPSPIQNFGGTSQSSPLTAGAAALVIEAYENTHHGVRPDPSLVKRLLTSTATDLGHPSYEQGAGLLNSLAAVQAAESWQDANGSPAPTGSALVVDRTQLSAVGSPGAVVQRNVFVRNVSDHTVTVNASTRSIGAPQTIASGDATLNTAAAAAFIDAFGISRSFVQQTFSVPAGHDRLDVTIAAAAPAGFSIRIILIDPNGTYTAYSIPQGFNNWAHVDVASPIAGTWKAIFAMSTSSGFNGPVHYLATTSDFTTAPATLKTPTFKLKPGESRREAVLATEPGHPGDVSASVQFAVAGEAATSVPLTLRAVVPASGDQFTDTMTGGNGRGGVAMSRFYSLDVSPGSTDMSVGITLTDPNEVVLATLSGPDGQVSSFRSNTFTDQSGNLQLSNGLQLYRRNPEGGRWVLGLWAQNPASGSSVSAPFTVNVAYDTAQVQGSPPNSLSTHLVADTPVDVPIQIKNTGANTLAYFADPRLNATGTVSLDELTGNATIPLPVPGGISPQWLVPSECTSATDVVTANQPVNLDFSYNSGEPDVYAANAGNGATATADADQVSPGLWRADVGQVGPFAGPAPAGTANVSATAHCKLFDTNTSSTTGDVWSAGVSGQNPRADVHVVDGKLVPRRGTAGTASSPVPTGPITLAPGQTATITVTITPAGASGTGVKGRIYIDTFDFFTDGGDEVAAIPYKYTIA